MVVHAPLGNAAEEVAHGGIEAKVVEGGLDAALVETGRHRRGVSDMSTAGEFQSETVPTQAFLRGHSDA